MKIQWLTPIEVIRNIDQILPKQRLEALEAGRGTAFAKKINIAKSFVHAGDNEEAKRSYSEDISIAWKRETNHDVLEAIEHELERSKKYQSQIVDLQDSMKITNPFQTMIPKGLQS